MEAFYGPLMLYPEFFGIKKDNGNSLVQISQTTGGQNHLPPSHPISTELGFAPFLSILWLLLSIRTLFRAEFSFQQIPRHLTLNLQPPSNTLLFLIGRIPKPPQLASLLGRP
ncbi:MAG: hypothetical protein HQL64_15980 [Magnetococcales bacterium]|nr:hypothetical protein [Magnetococcales bacterium]